MFRSGILGGIMAATFLAAPAAADQFHLYTPSTIDAPTTPAPPVNGLLTRTIVVRPGDTLSKLSRKYSGRSSYFPQILLFNSIRNPDLIRVGEHLQIPVTRHGVKSAKAPKVVKTPLKPSAVEVTRRQVREEKLFRRAVGLYHKGSYREAVTIFDTFLARYPQSLHAADAALYKADCYLQLSVAASPP